jgi:glycosyltransferase involved in cell wall biosynthesis
MRVLFDSYWFLSGPPSGRNVLRSYIDAWINEFPDDEVVLAVPRKELTQISRELGASHPAELRAVAGAPHGVSVLAYLDGRGFDVVIAQNFAPLRRARVSAVFVHDVIFVRQPKWFSRLERAYLRVSLMSLFRADVVLTSSRSERAQIQKVLSKRKRDSVSAVGLALSLGFERAEPEPPDGFDNSSNFLLAVGRINVRKNILFCAESLASGGLISPQRPLVIVGHGDGVAENFASIEQYIRDGSVIFAKRLTDAELKWMYIHTSLFIFPSLDEGFGLPILEAQYSRSPMVLSDISAFRELAPSETFFDPRETNSITRVVSEKLARTDEVPPRHTPSTSWSQVVRKSRNEIEKTQLKIGRR